MATLQDVLALAQRGVPVFPLRPGTKDGYLNDASDHGATTDSFTLYEWFKAGGIYAGYNFGAWTSGRVIIVDIDAGHGGLEAWAALQKEIGPIEPTFTVRSGRGGLHLYFENDSHELFSSADLVKGKINVRGTNGYVVGPGSEFYDPATKLTGRYEIADASPIAKIPAKLRERLRLRSATTSDAGKIVSDLDTPEAIAKARGRLSWALPAVQGQSGDQTTYELACALLDFGVSNDMAHALMLESWNGRCVPPWNPDELKVKVDNAWQYKQSGIGRDNPADGFYPMPAHLLRALNTVPEPKPADPEAEATPEEIDAFERRVYVDELTEDFVASLPDVEWAAQRRLIRGKICIFVAPPGLGKSTLTIQWAHGLVRGPQFNEKGEQVADFTGLLSTRKANVLVINGEDDLPEMQRRAAGVREFFKIPYKETHGRLRLMSAVDNPFVVLKREGKHLLHISPDVKALKGLVQRRGIDVVIVDPLVDMHEAQENDNGEMQRVMALWRKFAFETQCAVLIVHHTGKMPVAAADAYNGNMSASRGASAIVGAARTMVTFFNMSEKDAGKYNVPEQERGLYVRLDVAKNNHAPPEHEPQWFKRMSVKIPNGAFVGALQPWTFADTTAADASLIAGYLWDHLKADGELKLKTAAGILEKCPAYAGFGKALLYAKLRVIFDKQPVTEHNGQRLLFKPDGAAGGTLSIDA